MDTTSSTFDRLRASVEFPEPWKPQSGSPATLLGEVVAETEIPYKDLHTKEEKRKAAFVVRDQDGKEWSVAAFHAVLRNELWEHKTRGKAQVGDFVAIHYRGEGLTEDGRPVQRYRVAVERPQAAQATTGEREGADDDIPF